MNNTGEKKRMILDNESLQYPFVCAAVSVVFFILASGLYIYYYVEPPWKVLIFLLVPAVFSVPFGILANKGKIKPIVIKIVSKLLLVVFIAALIIFLALMTCARIFMVNKTDNPLYYKRAVADLNSGCVNECFPESVPENACDVEFSYINNSWCRHLYLSFSITNDELERWAVFLEKKAVWTGPNCELPDEYGNMDGFIKLDDMSTRYQLLCYYKSNWYALIDWENCRIHFRYVSDPF